MISHPLAPLTSPPLCARTEHTVRLGDGTATTLYVNEYDRVATRLRVVALERPMRLAEWCRAEGVSDAVVGGFFIRPDGAPLGDLWISGVKLASTAFDAPWDKARACVSIDGDRLDLGRRSELDHAPRGDLLQAGPLLVHDGRSLVGPGAADAEGFSAGARQFDSDITLGRYPRAALALAGGSCLAVVCDGRSETEAGLTLAELADALLDLGARTAINLDGGGSASLVSGFSLLNRPREDHGIELAGGRPVATALAFEPA